LLVLIRPRLQSREPTEPPLGILSLAAFIRDRRPSTEVSIIDAYLDDLSPVAIVDDLVKKLPLVVGMTISTQGASEAFDIIRQIRQHNQLKDVPIIAGGSHATALPDECLRHGATVCVVGEGEDTLLELLVALPWGDTIPNVPGVVFYDSLGQVVRSDARDFTPIDRIPLPAFDLVPVGRYTTEIHLDRVKTELAMPIMGSRGCSNNCAFCASSVIWRRHVRRRTPQSVVDEMLLYKQNYGVRQFHFYDDDLFLSNTYLLDLASLLTKTGLNIQFTCQATCRSLLQTPDSTLKRLQEVGLSLLELGIESLDPIVLTNIGKTQDLESIEAASEKLKRLRIDPYPLIMYLNPGETLKTHHFQATRFWEIFGWSDYVRNNYSKPGAFLFDSGASTPFPGTPLYSEVDKHGMLLTRDWQEYDTQNVVFLPHSLLAEVPRLICGEQPSVAREQFGILSTRALRYSPLGNPHLVFDRVWESIDGQRTIQEIGQELLALFQDDKPAKLLVAATIATLVLLVHGHLETAPGFSVEA
jgi:radical SAM superfamily enzyme YgiQ (UPF0313 family)